MTQVNIDINEGPFGEYENYSARVETIHGGQKDVIEVQHTEARRSVDGEWVDVPAEQVDDILGKIAPLADDEKVEAVREIIARY